MVLEVEEQAVGTVLGLLLCAIFDVGTGIRNCFLEYRKYVLVVVAARQELLVEEDSGHKHRVCMRIMLPMIKPVRTPGGWAEWGGM